MRHKFKKINSGINMKVKELARDIMSRIICKQNIMFALIVLLCMNCTSVLAQQTVASYYKDGKSFIKNNNDYQIIVFDTDADDNYNDDNAAWRYEGEKIKVKYCNCNEGRDNNKKDFNTHIIIKKGSPKEFESDLRNKKIIYYKVKESREKTLSSPEHFEVTCFDYDITKKNADDFLEKANQLKDTKYEEARSNFEKAKKCYQNIGFDQNSSEIQECTDGISYTNGKKSTSVGTTAGTGTNTRTGTNIGTKQKTEIQKLENEIQELESKCCPYLGIDTLSVDDRKILSAALDNCKVLLDSIEKIQGKSEKEKEKEKEKDRLEKLKKEILEALTKINIGELENKFKDQIFYAQDSTELNPLNVFNERTGFFDWWGIWDFSKNLKTLNQRIEEEKNKRDAIKNNFRNNVLDIYANIDANIINGMIDDIFKKFDISKEIEKCEKNTKKIPYMELSLYGVAFLLVVIIIVTIIVVRARRDKDEKRKQKEKEEINKKIEEQKKKSKKIILDDIDDANILPKYNYGLQEICNNVERYYKKINMFDLIKNEDTSIHNVYISRDCIKELHKFFNDSTNTDRSINETGCYIIGRWDYVPNSKQQAYDISLEYVVTPGDGAKYEKDKIVFGDEIGTKLEEAHEKYSEQFNIQFVRTSWMHSHPGHSLFLSQTDTDTQDGFTHNSPYKRLLAIVVDTQTENLEMAFFSPKASEDRKINNKTDIKKTLSLDELLKWAKIPYIEPQKIEPKNSKTDTETIKTSANEYFTVKLAEERNNITELKITRAVLNGIQNINEGILLGKHQNKTIFIDEPIQISTDNQNNTTDYRIGCFKEIINFENNEDWEKQKQNLINNEFWKSNKVLIISCVQDDNLYFFTKKPENNNFEIQNIMNVATVIPFRELKKWKNVRND